MYNFRWKSMYKIYSKNVDVKYVSQLRKAAIQGLESIRLIGNHGIDVQLMVFLAKNFASQVLNVLYLSIIIFYDINMAWL